MQNYCAYIVVGKISIHTLWLAKLVYIHCGWQKYYTYIMAGKISIHTLWLPGCRNNLNSNWIIYQPIVTTSLVALLVGKNSTALYGDEV